MIDFLPAVRSAAIALAAAGAFAQPALARNVALLRPVPEALAEPRSREIVGEMPLRFGKASLAGADILRRDVVVGGVATAANEIGRGGAGRESDETVCLHAFQDALAQLAAIARDARAGAILGVVSYYRHVEHDAPADYECHLGAFKAYVTLKAQLAWAAPTLPGQGAPPGFAALADVAAVPLGDAGRERYAHFLSLPKPRAFVVQEDGGWRFWSGDPDATAKAIDHCANPIRRCWLYAVDDRVVWAADPARRIGGEAPRPAGAPQEEHQ